MTQTPRLAIGCIRVSTDAQKEMFGPQRQREDIEKEARREELEIIQWVEESVSGANHARANENQYYDLARKTSGLHFIFSHPNRVGRHVEVVVGIARTIHKLGGTVWIVGLGNLRDARNWRYFLKDAADAEIDYSNIVYQIASGKRSKAQAGFWPHGSAPFGYTLERDHRGRSILPKPDQNAATIKRIFELSVSLGQVETLKIIRQEGWPLPPKGAWGVRTISNILSNERYTGRAIFQGITLDFEPIISRALWDEVQAVRAVRKHARITSQQNPLLWSGHMRCTECGAAMIRDGTLQHGKKYYYYRCWRAKPGEAARLGWSRACSNRKRWQQARTDPIWWEAFTEQATRPDILPLLLPSSAQPPSIPPTRLAELEAAIARAWEPFAAGKITQAIAERLAAPYEAEMKKLKAEYAPNPTPEYDYVAFGEQLRQLICQANTLEQRRELLDLYAVRLYIDQDGVNRIEMSVPSNFG